MEPLDDKNTAQLLQQMRRQTEIKPEQEAPSENASHGGGTFRIRLALAGVLFLTILLLDQNKKCFGGHLHGSDLSVCDRSRLRCRSEDLGGDSC